MEQKRDNENDSEGPPKKRAKIEDPPFIRYMLAPYTKHTCTFLVGDPLSDQPPEEIGVNKILLMAHSETFCRMLDESDLAEKGLVKITDIQPDTFKNFLRFVYGYNNISTLTMEEAVNLMYVAEKYLVEELKPKLSERICSILSVDNVCIPLQKPECFQQKSLNDAIIEVIQDYTGVLLHQQDFLDLNMFGVLNILKQDTLAVPEVELWKAVFKWANHNVVTKNGTTLRDLLKEPLNYLRLCTLTLEDFCKEVSLTKILTDQEVLMVIESIVRNDVLENLTTVCNTIEARNVLVKCNHEVYFHNRCNDDIEYRSSVSIVTKSAPVVLMSATFESRRRSIFEGVNNEGFYQCECKVSVIKSVSDYHHESFAQFVFKKNVDYGEEFQIPFIKDGQHVKLLGNNKYKLSFEFEKCEMTSLNSYNRNVKQGKSQTDHSLKFDQNTSPTFVFDDNYGPDFGRYIFCETTSTRIKKLIYKSR